MALPPDRAKMAAVVDTFIEARGQLRGGTFGGLLCRGGPDSIAGERLSSLGSWLVGANTCGIRWVQQALIFYKWARDDALSSLDRNDEARLMGSCLVAAVERLGG